MAKVDLFRLNDLLRCDEMVAKVLLSMDNFFFGLGDFTDERVGPCPVNFALASIGKVLLPGVDDLDSFILSQVCLFGNFDVWTFPVEDLRGGWFGDRELLGPIFLNGERRWASTRSNAESGAGFIAVTVSRRLLRVRGFSPAIESSGMVDDFSVDESCIQSDSLFSPLAPITTTGCWKILRVFENGLP
jgi:hypothetical protein